MKALEMGYLSFLSIIISFVLSNVMNAHDAKLSELANEVHEVQNVIEELKKAYDGRYFSKYRNVKRFFEIISSNTGFDVSTEHLDSTDAVKCPTERFCTVNISTRYPSCQRERNQDIAKAREWYELTSSENTKRTKFPLPIPWLNQPESLLPFHAAIDEEESRWASIFAIMRSTTVARNETIFLKMAKSKFFQYDDYKKVYEEFNEAIENLSTPQYFGNPMYGTDVVNKIIYHDYWLTDDFFEQKRFAGPCPFLIRKVTNSDLIGISLSTLKKQLNPLFQWDLAISWIRGSDTTIEEATRDGILYVVYHKEFNDIPTVEDQLDIDPQDSRTQLNMTSPIAVFVQNKHTGDLKIVAIQIDYKPDSEVFTTNSKPFQWQFAKSMVESVDTNICQAMHHLSHVHLTSTIFCTVFRRHFSKQNPLYDVMNNHCEGTSPHITMAWHILSTPNNPGHLLTGMGHLGFLNLSMQANAQYRYKILDFDKVLERSGLSTNSLNYNPFQEDGELIWNELTKFSKSFVDLYYSEDNEVALDRELQAFANEVSIDGSLQPDGGNGKVKGFPTQFLTKSDLQDFIRSFLWVNIFHVVVNYPVEPYNTFVPISPSKFYKDTSPEAANNFPHVLPDGPTTIGVSTFAVVLGNLRVNRIMDYYDKVRDVSLQKLVKKTHATFHTCIQKILEKRNDDRIANNRLPFVYLEPKWIPNSVHV